ncbi:MAG: ROK family protein [Phycisphaerales bacterium]|nr:ROK family protein [Phycisphaerales bacterium]
MKVLSVDIGGTGIKTLLDGEDIEKRTRVVTGPEFTPKDMLAAIKEMRPDGDFDVLAIGLPTAIRKGKPMIKPKNLGEGWLDFDFANELGKPVRLMNDAAMQAVGSYEGGKMLFLGLGTGLGTTLVNDYQVDAMELAHLPYKHGKTFEEYVGEAYRESEGTKDWRKEVWKVIELLYHALLPEYVCLGGGNAKRISKHEDEIPEYVRIGANANAFAGGFRVWQDERYEASVPVLSPSASS